MMRDTVHAEEGLHRHKEQLGSYSRAHAAAPVWRVAQGSTCSSTSICSSVRSAIRLCFQPVVRKMWIARGRAGVRLPLMISLA